MSCSGSRSFRSSSSPTGTPASGRSAWSWPSSRLGAKFKQQPRAHWVEEFAPRGIQGGPVQDYAEILADEQARANGYVAVLAHPVRGELPVVGSPFAVVGTPAAPPPLPVEAGADTAAGLEAVGFDGDAIAKLRAEGAIQ